MNATDDYNPFKEFVIEELCNFFKNHPTELFWHGTAQEFSRLMQSNPLNDGMIKRRDYLSLYEVFRTMAVQFCLETGVWSIPRLVFSTNKTNQ